jgi:hypothetical protein
MKLSGWKLVNIKSFDAAFVSDFVEGFDFGFGEEKAARFLTACCEGRFHLSREDTLFVSVSENVTQNCFDILLLVTSMRKHAAADCIGVNDLEEECTVLFFSGDAGAATDGGE